MGNADGGDRMTPEIIKEVEHFNAMKEIRDNAFRIYCNDNRPDNYTAYMSAQNGVTDAAHTLAEMVSKELRK